MTLLRNLVVVGLAGSLLLGCGGSDDDTSAPGSTSVPGGASVDPSDCSAVGAKVKALNTALGCKNDVSSSFSTQCQALHALDMCVSEWNAMINCVAPKPLSNFECDDSDELELKSDVCSSERRALDACFGDD